MRLELPTPEMEGAYLEFARDWAEHHEEITPYSARLLGHSYAEWLADANLRITKEMNGFVTAHTYFWINPDGVIVGAINLRHRLNAFLLRTGGHIGYGVRPSCRRQGHASKMLAAALPYARELGLTRVLITCDKQNTGSARTIQKNGGVLEDEITDDGTVTQRYWIAL